MITSIDLSLSKLISLPIFSLVNISPGEFIIFSSIFFSVLLILNSLLFLIINNNQEFKINNTEKIILEKMINSPGQTFTREEIGKLINLDKERSIDVIITRLRKKIENDPKNPKFLQTIRGTGYVLWIE